MRVRHPKLKAAAQLPHVTALLCHDARPGLLEKHVEKAVIEALEIAGWYVIKVAAEAGNGTGKARKRDPRAAEPGTLDLVAYEPLPKYGFKPIQGWLIEVKNGDRDLTDEQLETVERAPRWGLRVMLVDEAALVRDWLKERG